MSRDDDSSNYKYTSEQLDSITTTVVTTILSAFIISQDLFNDSSHTIFRVASIFSLSALFLHYISYILAHYAQIYIIKNKTELSNFFGWWTRKVNGLVYIMVSIMFIFAGWIILFGR